MAGGHQTVPQCDLSRTQPPVPPNSNRVGAETVHEGSSTRIPCIPCVVNAGRESAAVFFFPLGTSLLRWCALFVFVARPPIHVYSPIPVRCCSARSLTLSTQSNDQCRFTVFAKTSGYAL